MSGPLKIVGQVQAGIAAKAAGKFNNRIAQRNADETDKETSALEQRTRADGRAVAGEAIAQMGASGFQIGSGSALDVLRESAVNNELDVLTIRRKGRLTSEATRTGGALALMQGKQAQKAAFIGAAAEVAKQYENAVAAGGQAGG